jgi:histidyl-tRNA synthetase
VTTSLGAQGTVLGGGRSEGIMGVMGGPETPGVGWAAGIERLALLIEEPPAPPRPIALVPLGKPAEMLALRLAQSLRRAGFAIELGYSGNLKRRLQRANKINARAAVILGDDEIAKQAAAVRDLDSGEQAEIPLASLAERLAAFR